MAVAWVEWPSMAGEYDWSASSAFSELAKPVEGYHGLRIRESFGSKSPAGKLQTAYATCDSGSCMSPSLNAWISLQGLETLAHGGKKHCGNVQMPPTREENKAKV